MYFILENKQPVQVSDVLVWGAWMQTGDQRVAETVIDDIRVSTVFLGLDHNHFGGTPVLFETMIFTSDNGGGEMDRYCTWDDAVRGHVDMVRRIEVERELAGLAVGDSLAGIIVKLRNNAH